MIDNSGRTINYLRISVTDRCNFRCRYCMPEDGIDLINHEDILTYQEILRICRAGTGLGIHNIKITGGEPLVRKGIVGLIRELSHIDGIESVTMTTNGCLLAEMSAPLKEAGLSAVNVSLDTLSRERFARITRKDCFHQVMEGIGKAASAGLQVKINCAVMEGLDEDEVAAFARFSLERHIPVRFIEMMPIGQGRAFKTMDNEGLKQILSGRYPDFHQSELSKGNGPAVYYEFQDDSGCVGFISAVHQKFCGGCNRVRLTSTGFLKLCLDSEKGIDLCGPLRKGMKDQELSELMKRWIAKKPEGHHFATMANSSYITMNQIGG